MYFNFGFSSITRLSIGNESTKTFTFTIDKSVPVVTTYKNDEVYTGKGDYHNEEVSATIAVEDANPDLKGEITEKGIPVVDKEGEQVCEIERNEIIFSKELTD